MGMNSNASILKPLNPLPDCRRSCSDTGGWDGVPDMDIIFQFGVLLRVVLINTVLLPLALFARWMSRRRIKTAMQPVA